MLMSGLREIFRLTKYLLLIAFMLMSANSWAQTQPVVNPVPAANNSAVNVGGSLPAIPGLPALTVKTNKDGTQEYTVTLQILGVMTMLTFLPALLMMVTSFTRIIIVFSILRQALGLQQSPSNQILIGLALFLTFFKSFAADKVSSVIPNLPSTKKRITSDSFIAISA